jgi:hypothetical protein
MRILIDRNVERYAVTHGTRMVPQTIKWGPRTSTVPVAQRCYDRPGDDELFIQEQLPYLVSLCNAAKEGKVEFCTSSELFMEAVRQPISKQGYLGIDFLSGVTVTKVPCPVDRLAQMRKVIIPTVDFGKDEQLKFFETIQHPRFLHLRTTLGDAQLADAFHLWTAETASLDVFLTMDKKFLNNVHNRRNTINSTVSVLAPKDVCGQIGLPPADIEQLAIEINPYS